MAGAECWEDPKERKWVVPGDGLDIEVRGREGFQGDAQVVAHARGCNRGGKDR